jgi:hypothetical protein
MKVNVLISQSAVAFTSAQEKKIVVGAKLIERLVGIKRGDTSGKFSTSKFQHTIKEIERTKSGSIKSITTQASLVLDGLTSSGKVQKSSGQQTKFTASEFLKLLNAPLPKISDGKRSSALRFGDATDYAASKTILLKSLRDIDKQIDALRFKREVIQSKLGFARKKP